MKASLFAVCSSQDESESAKVGAVRQSILAILARVVWFVCVCVWLMCGSALFEPCGAAFFRVHGGPLPVSPVGNNAINGCVMGRGRTPFWAFFGANCTR